MWQIEKGEAQSRATITAMKDGEDGLDWTFRLRPYHFDENGGPKQGETTTCTVEILTNPSLPKQGETDRNRKPLSPSPKMLLDVVKRAVEDSGELVKGHLNVPPTIRSVTRD